MDRVTALALWLAVAVAVAVAGCGATSTSRRSEADQDRAFFQLPVAERLSWIDCQHSILAPACVDDPICVQRERDRFAAAPPASHGAWLVDHGCPRSTVEHRIALVAAWQGEPKQPASCRVRVRSAFDSFVCSIELAITNQRTSAK